jgi:hypothetical protein
MIDNITKRCESTIVIESSFCSCNKPLNGVVRYFPVGDLHASKLSIPIFSEVCNTLSAKMGDLWQLAQFALPVNKAFPRSADAWSKTTCRRNRRVKRQLILC